MIQEDLKSMLTTALPAVPVYPNIAMQGSALPYIVYQRLISQVENILAGNGNPPINNSRIQIDVWSQSYASVQATAASVRSAMLGWNVQNISQGEQDFYESDTRLHRVMMDYSIWHYD
jgi:hypothetical protein